MKLVPIKKEQSKWIFMDCTGKGIVMRSQVGLNDSVNHHIFRGMQEVLGLAHTSQPEISPGKKN